MKLIGFIGDRISGKCPVPVVTPANNMCIWKKVTVADFVDYFRAEGNTGTLWKPTNEVLVTKQRLPK